MVLHGVGGGCRDGAGTGSGDVVDVLDELHDKRTVKEEEIEEQELNRNNTGSSSISNDHVIQYGGSPSSSSCCLIKEESAAAMRGVGANSDCGGDDGNCSSSAKPMEGLYEIGPPPFLKKTYEMVEDPETDPVVSWSEARNSFIVWDSHQLSKNLLPKYFKHCNFSSFIRQLNTYGFRKIDSDKWEFANEGFQGGKKHLLKNIKRRSRYNNYKKKHLGMGMTLEDLTKPVVETELESLKTDNNILKVEMLKLREQQQDSQYRLTMVEERVRCAECKQQKMLSFLTKMSRNPASFRQLLQRRMLRKELNGNHDFGKRLLAMQGHQNYGVESINTSQEVNCENHVQEELLSMQSDLTQMFPEVTESRKVETAFQASIDNKSTSSGAANYKPPSTMFAENMAVNEEYLTTNDSKFILELEDLIKKPRDCASGYVQKQVFHGCVGSIL